MHHVGASSTLLGRKVTRQAAIQVCRVDMEHFGATEHRSLQCWRASRTSLGPIASMFSTGRTVCQFGEHQQERRLLHVIAKSAAARH